jgi:uncharacterized membrane protein YqaE (UPF0057 family)
MKKLLVRTFLVVTCLATLSVFNGVNAIVPINSSNTTETAEELAINNAMAEFKALNKKERNARFKEAKKAIKQYKADKKAGKVAKDDDHVLAIIFAILIPPVGVIIHEKKVTTKFWISLLLTLLFWLPGAIYSLLVVTGNA